MKITREELAMLLGEHVAIFDCHECAEGIFVGTTTEAAHCNQCGAPMPRHVREVADEVSGNGRHVA